MLTVATLVLTVGAVLLGLGSVSLLIVKLTSPGLRGMGLLSAAFATGAVGAGLLLVPNWPVLNALLADVCLLSSFVLLHIAVLELLQRNRSPLWPGWALLAVQAVITTLRIAGVLSGANRIEILGVLVAFQAFVTTRLLWDVAGSKVRPPAIYCMVLLLAFGGFNLLRSGLVLSGWLTSGASRRLSVLAFALYLAVAFGLAFGFFWATTASLTEEVEHIASTDPLTRVYNRRVFLRWCEKELLRSQRSSSPFSLLMVDLDHFKRVNDNFGHQRGDEVLVAAVERMQDSVRGIDVLCRWGGEEFAVLLPNASSEATQLVAERIRENIMRMQIRLSETRIPESSIEYLTASIGAATYRGLEDGIAAMLLRADRALYRAKSGGRNRVLIGA